MVLLDPPRHDIDSAELNRFALRARRLAGVVGNVDILISGNDRLRRLNRHFRKKNKPTDVLSFPSPEGNGGDIAISAEIAAENASRYGHAVSHELKVLILHGMLHLAGYDHERDNGEMAAREHALRKRLSLATSLIERNKTRESTEDTANRGNKQNFLTAEDAEERGEKAKRKRQKSFGRESTARPRQAGAGGTRLTRMRGVKNHQEGKR